MAAAAACPFCSIVAAAEGSVGASAWTLAIRDRHPVTDGHTLVIPRRHVLTPLDLEDHEWADALALARLVARNLEATRRPDGFNVGFNAGAAAGQTVAHAHIHVIPRYAGDHPDPRGGIRWVVPSQAQYWERPSERA